MLDIQYNTLIHKINTALSEPQTRVAQAVYEDSRSIITSFYTLHKDETPTIFERNKLIDSLLVLIGRDSRNTITCYTVIIWVIDVYKDYVDDDQLELEYRHKIRSIYDTNINVEELESVGPNF